MKVNLVGQQLTIGPLQDLWLPGLEPLLSKSQLAVAIQKLITNYFIEKNGSYRKGLNG